MSRTVSIPEEDAVKAVIIVREMMARYYLRDYVNSAYCEFCRQEEDENRNIHHKVSCEGLRVLENLEKAIKTPPMCVNRIGDLIGQKTIAPNDGVDALKWLTSRGTHDMNEREVLRTIRTIKIKMGIPF